MDWKFLSRRWVWITINWHPSRRGCFPDLLSSLTSNCTPTNSWASKWQPSMDSLVWLPSLSTATRYHLLPTTHSQPSAIYKTCSCKTTESSPYQRNSLPDCRLSRTSDWNGTRSWSSLRTSSPVYQACSTSTWLRMPSTIFQSPCSSSTPSC